MWIYFYLFLRIDVVVSLFIVVFNYFKFHFLFYNLNLVNLYKLLAHKI